MFNWKSAPAARWNRHVVDATFVSWELRCGVISEVATNAGRLKTARDGDGYVQNARRACAGAGSLFLLPQSKAH